MSEDATDAITEQVIKLTPEEQVQSERDGWRRENDRHRHLYVEAVKGRDTAELERDRLRDDQHELQDLLSQIVFAVVPEPVPDGGRIIEVTDAPDMVRAVVAERDRLRDILRETYFWFGPAESSPHGDYGVIPVAAKRVTDERNRLRAVIRKVVACAGIALEGKSDEWLSYACEEYAGPHEFDPDELAAYRRALDVSPTGEATDG